MYQPQRMEGELAATVQKHLAHIGDIQPADNPDRNEPGADDFSDAFPFAHLDRIGNSGWTLQVQARSHDGSRDRLAQANGPIARPRRSGADPISPRPA